MEKNSKRFRELDLLLDSLKPKIAEALNSFGSSLAEDILINVQRTPGWIAIERTKKSLRLSVDELQAEVSTLLNPRPGGSKAGRSIIQRNFKDAFDKLMVHYFNPTPLYGDHLFRRRFRFSKSIFERIYNACAKYSFFKHSCNAAGRWGIHPLVKIVAVLRHFAYGTSADQMDEQFQLSETTLMDSRIEFCDVSYTAVPLHTLIRLFCSLTPFAGNAE